MLIDDESRCAVLKRTTRAVIVVRFFTREHCRRHGVSSRALAHSAAQTECAVCDCTAAAAIGITAIALMARLSTVIKLLRQRCLITRTSDIVWLSQLATSANEARFEHAPESAVYTAMRHSSTHPALRSPIGASTSRTSPSHCRSLVSPPDMLTMFPPSTIIHFPRPAFPFPPWKRLRHGRIEEFTTVIVAVVITTLSTNIKN